MCCVSLITMDMHTIRVVFAPTTRQISLTDDTKYGGATIDSNSVSIVVEGIVPEGEDFTARLDFAVPVMTDNHTVYKPFVLLEQDGEDWFAVIPQSILMATRETHKLPFQLVLRHGDTIINSRNTIVLEVTRAINAANSVAEVYGPYIMYRDDSWGWISDFTYKAGSVVTYDGELYISKIDGNKNHRPTPTDNSPYWGWLEDMPDERSPGQVIVSDANSQALWQTVSKRANVTTSGNTPYTLAHGLVSPVSCTFYDTSTGQQVDVAYTTGENNVTFETTSAQSLTVVITSLPYQEISS